MSRVIALIKACASVKPQPVMEMYMLVASTLSSVAIALAICAISSSVGSRFISNSDLRRHWSDGRKHGLYASIPLIYSLLLLKTRIYLSQNAA